MERLSSCVHLRSCTCKFCGRQVIQRAMGALLVVILSPRARGKTKLLFRKSEQLQGFMTTVLPLQVGPPTLSETIVLRTPPVPLKPQTLKECTKTSHLVQNLYEWDAKPYQELTGKGHFCRRHKKAQLHRQCSDPVYTIASVCGHPEPFL
jgi:hypothetical protein